MYSSNTAAAKLQGYGLGTSLVLLGFSDQTLEYFGMLESPSRIAPSSDALFWQSIRLKSLIFLKRDLDMIKLWRKQ